VTPAPVPLLDTTRDLVVDGQRDPLRWVRWTPPQHAFLESQYRIRLLRTGNQFGKTWAGAADAIWRCLGSHPYQEVRPGPIEAWVICKSWSQSIAVQSKLWHLVPKDAVTPDTAFSPKNGFKGVQRAIVFRNGSILRVKTVGQDTLDLASATIHYIWIDEPLGDAETFSELQMRLRRTAGSIGITMTPATTGDLAWLRDLVEGGKATDMHYRMDAANFIPVGSSRPLLDEAGTPMDSAWCADQIESTLGWARPVRCHGEWEYGRINAIFENFHPLTHVVPGLTSSDVRPRGELKLSIGVDYGEERLRTAAVLIGVDDSDPEMIRVYVLGEYAPDSATTIDMDAAAILEMVAAHGLRWSDLDHCYGDKRLQDARGRITRKSNSMLTRALEKAMRKRAGIVPRFKGAKRGIGRGAGSVWMGVKWINDRMITPGCYFNDAGTPRLIECLQKWQGGTAEEWKDQIDALRYALRPWIFPMSRKPIHTVRFG